MARLTIVAYFIKLTFIDVRWRMLSFISAQFSFWIDRAICYQMETERLHIQGTL